jgi:ribonuclease J
LIPIGDHQRRRIGTFDCEFLPVTHSTPSSLLTVFRTPQGVIVHSGDFKIDPLPVDGRTTDVDRVAAIAKEEGVRLLLADSTNADSPGATKSETHIGDVLRGVFLANRGRRIIVASFASHVHRLQQVADIAVSEGRKIAILGTSMVRNTKLARDIGLMHIPSNSIIPPDELNDLDPAHVCVICTGSQGESRAVLWQLVTGENRYMSISKDDTVVLSAHPIPGNETSVARLRNRLTLLGARVVHDGILEVHTSGHAKQDELATLMRAANPEWFVPIHGEVAHLAAHAELAREVLPIADDHVVVCAEGDTLVLSDSGMVMGPEIPARRVYVHGTVDGVDDAVLRDRKTLGDDGFVLVAVDVHLEGRPRAGEPRVISRGWAAEHDRTALHEAVADAVRRSLRDLLADPGDEGTTREQVERAVRRAAGSTVNERSRRRPMIVPVVTYN